MPDVAKDVLNMTPQYVEKALQIIEELIKLLKKDKEDRSEAAAAREIEKYLKKGGDLQTFINKDFSEKDFAQAMKEMGCACKTARCVYGPSKGLIMCMFKEEDLPFAMMAREKAMSRGRQTIDEYGNIMQPASEVSINTLNLLAKEDGLNHVGRIKGIEPVKAKMLVEEFRTSGIVFARQESEKGDRTDFYFSRNDTEKVRNALAKTNIALLGVSGNYTHQSLSGDLRMTKTALNRIEKDGDEFYVVSAANPDNVIHVTNTSVTHQLMGEGRPHSYRIAGGREGNYDQVNLRTVYKQEVDTLKRPVVLSKEEYRKGAKDREYMDKLVSEKMSRVVYRNESDKVQTYTENFIKNKLTQKLYGRIRAGEFDPAVLKADLESVQNGETSLADFLDISGDILAPAGIDDKALERKQELMDYCDHLSPEEYEMAVSLLSDAVEEYDKAENMIGLTQFEDAELHQSLDDLINDAKNSISLSGEKLLEEYNVSEDGIIPTDEEV